MKIQHNLKGVKRLKNQLWRAQKVSERLGVSPWRVYELTARKIIPEDAVVRLGRSIFFNPEAIEAWIKAGGSKASA